jgi:Family of unknown function (DUF6526)
MRKQQTLANHAKFDLPFHFLILPVLLVNIEVVAYLLFRSPRRGGAWLLLVSIALLVLAGRTRAFATGLQDRIICGEEQLRLAALLEEPARSRIAELSGSQLIGLRFASDAEVPALAQRALDEKLNRGEIKKAITNWRRDDSRV